jgi:hypothetical protein
VFAQADGKVATCTKIGDLPVIARTKTGALVQFTFTNARYVPSLRTTFSRFANSGASSGSTRGLRMSTRWFSPDAAGSLCLAYDAARELPTLHVVSAEWRGVVQRWWL